MKIEEIHIAGVIEAEGNVCRERRLHSDQRAELQITPGARGQKFKSAGDPTTKGLPPAVPGCLVRLVSASAKVGAVCGKDSCTPANHPAMHANECCPGLRLVNGSCR